MPRPTPSGRFAQMSSRPSRPLTERQQTSAEDHAASTAIIKSMGTLIEAWALRMTPDEAKQIAELAVRVDLLYRELSTHKVRTLESLALKRIAQQTQAELADVIQAVRIARQ